MAAAEALPIAAPTGMTLPPSPTPSTKATAVWPSRHGGVCGIEAYDNLARLLHVKYDVTGVSRSLRETGFFISDESVLISEGDAHTTSKWVDNFLAQGEIDAVYILHFSAHGIRIGEHALLMTKGFDPSKPAMHTYTVLPDDKFLELTQSRTINAKMVILSFDVCSEEVQQLYVQLQKIYIGMRRPPEEREVPVIFVFGSHHGEKVMSIKGRGGHYSRAFAEAICPKTPPRSILEAIEYAKRRTLEYCEESKHKPQRVTFFAHPVDLDLLNLQIFCSSEGDADQSEETESSATIRDILVSEYPLVEIPVSDGTIIRGKVRPFENTTSQFDKQNQLNELVASLEEELES